MNKHVTRAAHEPLQPVKKGVWKRALVEQASLAVIELFFDDGIETSYHPHDVDQTVYHVSGKFQLRLPDEVIAVGPGDGYFLPAGLAHSIHCVEKGSYVLTSVGVVQDDAHSLDAHEHDSHKH